MSSQRVTRRRLAFFGILVVVTFFVANGTYHLYASSASRVQVNTGVWYQVADSADLFAFSENVTVRGFDPSVTAWTWYDLDFGDGDRLSSVQLAPSDENVTFTKLNQSPKLVTASVSAVSSSSKFSMILAGYAYPYIANVTGNVSAIDVQIYGSTRLLWSLTGTGDITITAVYSGSLSPYYVTINGYSQLEGDVWSHSAGVVTISDTVSSTHTYVLSFEAAGGSSDGGEPTRTDQTPTEEFVERIVAPSLFAITDNWISVFLLTFFVLATVVAYVRDSPYWWVFLSIAVILTVNFVAVYVLVPQLLFPLNLSFLEPLLFKPPTLQLQTYPIATQQVIQLVTLSVLGLSFVASFVMVMVRRQ